MAARVTQLVSYALVVTLSASPVLLTACAAWCGVQVHETTPPFVSSTTDAHAGHVADVAAVSSHRHHADADQGPGVDEDTRQRQHTSHEPRGAYRLGSNGRGCAVAVVSPATLRQAGRGQVAPSPVALPVVAVLPTYAAQLKSHLQLTLPPPYLLASETRIPLVLRV